MASRPVWNAAARVWSDNNAASEALRNAYVLRASTAVPDTASEAIVNGTFRAKAGIAQTLNYDIRKFGGGVSVNPPTFGRIRIYKADDNQAATTGAVAESADIIAAAALPLTGTFSFTPTECGTFRIALEMRNGANNFGGTSSDWTIFSDGVFQAGGLSNQVRAVQMDKGRFLYGADLNSITITERGSTPPSTFAVTMNAGQTALQEAVRVDAVLSHAQNLSVANINVFKFKQRRNGTATIDQNITSTVISTTQHRSEGVVNLLNFPANNVATVYDTQVVVEALSVLHTANTPQYSGLGGQDADGIWTYFTAVGAGLTLTDYKTATKLATHTVNPGGSITNVGCYSAKVYTEDGSGVPVPAEAFSYIFTDDNMTVKMLGVLNARSEILPGIFVVGEASHEATGQNILTWGNNDASFKTNALGNGVTAKTVTVTTPPSGIYKVTGTAYFPGTTFGAPALREFSAVRIESGSPASASAGKDWIAPASFNTAWIVGEDPIKGGALKTVTLAVFDKDLSGDIVFKDADFVPVVNIFKRQPDNTLTAFATPVVTGIGLGQYSFPFTPDVVALGGKDVYFIAADVTVGSFKRRWGEDITVFSMDLPTHNHDGVSSDKPKFFFDPTGLFK